MALFSSKEKRATLLTQFYQLEGTHLNYQGELIFDYYFLVDSELDIWLFRFRELPHYGSALEHAGEMGATYRVKTIDPETGESWSKYQDRINHNGEAHAHLQSIAHLQQLLRKAMDAAADGTDLGSPHLEQLNEWLVDALAPPFVAWETAKRPRVEYLRNKAFFPVIASLLAELLKSINEASLVRCGECSNVFPKTRQGQKFCSERCSNRASVQMFRRRNSSGTRKAASVQEEKEILLSNRK